MEAWLEIVTRQLILYSLPLVISLSIVGMVEAATSPVKEERHPFFAIAWRGTWLPFFASLLFTRGMIVALPQPHHDTLRAAAIRLTAHAGLALIGFLLYAFALDHLPPRGVPPLHHWWAKLFMYFNLCIAALHLLPLPGLLTGELFVRTRIGRDLALLVTKRSAIWMLTLLAASPLLDLLLGGFIVYPIYEQLANAATRL